MNKVWIIKYALTKGILEAETEDDLVGLITIKAPNGARHYYHEREYAGSESEALRMAEQMRLKRIRSSKKTLDKLENMKIKIGEYK